MKGWEVATKYEILEHSVTNMKFRYEYDTNEYSWRKIFEYIRISEYSSHYDTNEQYQSNNISIYHARMYNITILIDINTKIHVMISMINIVTKFLQKLHKSVKFWNAKIHLHFIAGSSAS